MEILLRTTTDKMTIDEFKAMSIGIITSLDFINIKNIMVGDIIEIDDELSRDISLSYTGDIVLFRNIINNEFDETAIKINK